MEYEDRLRIIAWNVKALRRKYGLSQMELSEYIEMSLRHIQRLEAGRQNVTLRTLHRYSSYFNISICDIIKDASKAPLGDDNLQILLGE